MCHDEGYRPGLYIADKFLSAAVRRSKGTLAGDAPYHSYLRVGRTGALIARGRSLERRTPIDETGRNLLNGGRYGGTCERNSCNVLNYQYLIPGSNPVVSATYSSFIDFPNPRFNPRFSVHARERGEYWLQNTPAPLHLEINCWVPAISRSVSEIDSHSG